ncbi:MFS transporter [Thermopolyspora sp. NPDC052614]|uniref:MFS transporter n=1 Tax=Thermopolyspora sp. NPDC052614 TaxID=3155682 RepID=UPI00341A906C
MPLRSPAPRAVPAAYGDTPTAGREDDGESPERGGRARLLMLVCAGAIGITMADTIGGTLAVSALTPAFTGPGMTEADLQWVMTAYAVPFAALLAAAGRLADLVGRRRLLAIGLGLFSLGAAAAAVSMSFPVLLVARAVQGVGSAAAVPASLGMLLAGVPAHRRPGAIGLWMAGSGIGGTAVHAAGGWLLGFQGWRAMFLPSAVIAMLLVYGTLALRRDATTTGRAPDPVGAVALFAAIGTAVLAITKAPQWGWSPAMAALFAGVLLMLLVAVFRSLRHPVPVLAMSLWRTPMFGLAGTVSLLYGLIAFPVLIVVPLFLHRAWGYDLTVAAPAMAPLSAGVLVAGYLSGKACKRYGPRAIIYLGSVGVAASCAWVITMVLQPEPRLLTAWLPASVLLGLGLGAMTTGASTAGTLSAPPTEYAAAIGGTMTARQIGGAVGMAGAAVLVGRLTVNNTFSGYTAVFAGCMILAGLAGLVAVFIRPRPLTDGPATASEKAPQPPAASLFTPPDAVALPRFPVLTGPALTGPALTGPASLDTPVSSPAVPHVPSAMPLSAPVPGDYGAAPNPVGHPAAYPAHPPVGHPVAHPAHDPLGHPADHPVGHIAEISAATVRITGPHVPVPLAPPTTEAPPHPRTRRGSATRSRRSRERAHRAKERAQAESELRTAATHFLAAADKLTLPGPALPQYYLPEPPSAASPFPGPALAEPTATLPTPPESAASEPTTPQPSVAQPSVAQPSVAQPSVTEPSVTEPSVTEPSVTETSDTRQRPYRRMPYSGGNFS